MSKFSFKYAIAFLCLALALFFVTSCKTGTASVAGENKLDSSNYSKTLEKPIPAPDFTLTDSKGKTLSLSELKGKVVWITFWATWCHACKLEMQHLEKVRRKLGDQVFEIIAVSIDSAAQKNEAIAISRAMKFGGRVVFDSDTSTINQYSSKIELPFSVLVDKNGNQRLIQRGFIAGDEHKIEQQVVDLLKE